MSFSLPWLCTPLPRAVHTPYKGQTYHQPISSLQHLLGGHASGQCSTPHALCCPRWTMHPPCPLHCPCLHAPCTAPASMPLALPLALPAGLRSSTSLALCCPPWTVPLWPPALCRHSCALIIRASGPSQAGFPARQRAQPCPCSHQTVPSPFLTRIKLWHFVLARINLWHCPCSHHTRAFMRTAVLLAVKARAAMDVGVEAPWRAAAAAACPLLPAALAA